LLIRPPLPSRQPAATDVPAVAALPDEPLAGAAPGTALQDLCAGGCRVVPTAPGMRTPARSSAPPLRPPHLTAQAAVRSSPWMGLNLCYGSGGCRPSSFCPNRCSGGAGVSSGRSPALGLCRCQSPALSQEGLEGTVPMRYGPQGDTTSSSCASSISSHHRPLPGQWRAPVSAGTEGQPGSPPAS